MNMKLFTSVHVYEMNSLCILLQILNKYLKIKLVNNDLRLIFIEASYIAEYLSRTLPMYNGMIQLKLVNDIFLMHSAH
jgi:hypothetical protein